MLDILWKGILDDLPSDAIMLLPEVADSIDFSKPIESLDKELNEIALGNTKAGNKHVDKLFKVWDKTGQEQWFLIHIEVQGQYEKDFAFRMYQYFVRIREKYKRDVAALAIYTDGGATFSPNEYRHQRFGTELIFRFNTYKILQQDEQALLNSQNPFASVVLTVLYAIKAKRLIESNHMGLEEQIKQYFIKQGEKRGKRAGVKIGKEIGKEIGVEIGKEAVLVSIVKNLIASGMSLMQIAQVTGLSLDQIEAYRAKE